MGNGGGDPRAESEALQAGAREHDAVEVPRVQLPEARVDVAPHWREASARDHHRELRDAPHAAGADRRRRTQRRARGLERRGRRRTREHERVARVLAWQDPGDGQRLRRDRRHVLRAVHREIDAILEQRLLDFLNEEPLVARLGERRVLQPIAGGLDDDELH